jgi:hypothetical protein
LDESKGLSDGPETFGGIRVSENVGELGESPTYEERLPCGLKKAYRSSQDNGGFFGIA